MTGISAAIRATPTKNVLRLKLVAAGREAIDELRNSGAMGDTAYRRAEEELDQVEISARIGNSD